MSLRKMINLADAGALRMGVTPSTKITHAQSPSVPAFVRETLSESVAWHTLSVAEIAARLGSDPARTRGIRGRPTARAIRPERLAVSRGRSPLAILWRSSGA